MPWYAVTPPPQPSRPVSVKGVLSNGSPTLLSRYEIQVPTDTPLKLFVETLSQRHLDIPQLDMRSLMGWWMPLDTEMESMWILALGSGRRTQRWDLGLPVASFSIDDEFTPLRKWASHDLSQEHFELLIYVAPPTRDGWLNNEEYHEGVQNIKVDLENLPTATLADVEDLALVLLSAVVDPPGDTPLRTRHDIPEVPLVFVHNFDPYHTSIEDIHGIAQVLNRCAYQYIMDMRMALS
jgi:hypothetical protein